MPAIWGRRKQPWAGVRPEQAGRGTMKSCPKMVDAGRRHVMTGAGFAAAGAVAASVVPSPSKAAPAPARVEYPSNRLANLRDLRLNEPLRPRPRITAPRRGLLG